MYHILPEDMPPKDRVVEAFKTTLALHLNCECLGTRSHIYSTGRRWYPAMRAEGIPSGADIVNEFFRVGAVGMLVRELRANVGKNVHVEVICEQISRFVDITKRDPKSALFFPKVTGDDAQVVIPDDRRNKSTRERVVEAFDAIRAVRADVGRLMGETSALGRRSATLGAGIVRIYEGLEKTEGDLERLCNGLVV